MRALIVDRIRVLWAPNANWIAFSVVKPDSVFGVGVANWILPAALFQLKPSTFNALRLTSAILTRRLTWFGVATDSWLTTLPLVSLAIALARAVTFSARPALD